MTFFNFIFLTFVLALGLAPQTQSSINDDDASSAPPHSVSLTSKKVQELDQQIDPFSNTKKLQAVSQFLNAAFPEESFTRSVIFKALRAETPLQKIFQDLGIEIAPSRQYLPTCPLYAGQSLEEMVFYAANLGDWVANKISFFEDFSNSFSDDYFITIKLSAGSSSSNPAQISSSGQIKGFGFENSSFSSVYKPIKRGDEQTFKTISEALERRPRLHPSERYVDRAEYQKVTWIFHRDDQSKSVIF